MNPDSNFFSHSPIISISFHFYLFIRLLSFFSLIFHKSRFGTLNRYYILSHNLLKIKNFLSNKMFSKENGHNHFHSLMVFTALYIFFTVDVVLVSKNDKGNRSIVHIRIGMDLDGMEPNRSSP